MKTTPSGAASVSPHFVNPILNAVAPSESSEAGLRVGIRISDMATTAMLNKLPKLDDDADIGVEREHTVRRDDEADLKFTGVLKASVAPEYRAQSRWREYRIYETKAGHLVLSRIGRSIKDDERDRFEAAIYKRAMALVIDDTPTYRKEGVNALLPTEDLRKVLVGFFGFDDLAKELYRKLGVNTEQTLD